MEIKLLGPVEIVTELGCETVTSMRMRSLVAIFGLAQGRTVFTTTLLRELWADDLMKNAKNACHATISRLRRLTEVDGCGLIETRPSGYRVATERCEVDVDRFIHLGRAARDTADSGNAQRAVDLIDQAIALIRGPILDDVDDCPLLAGERVALEEQYFSLLELRASCLLRLGLSSAVTSSLLPLTRKHPDRERLHAQLMVALYKEGRQAEALSTYQQVMEHLREEYGLMPGAHLQRVHQAILQRTPIESLMS